MLAPVLHAPRTEMRVLEVELDPPKAGEVSVRMTASGVCHSCLHVLDGSVGGAPMPMVLGDEGAGVVTAVGPGVTAVKPDDHVIISWAPTCGRCRYCIGGRPVLCANQPPFGYLGDGTTRMHLDGTDVHNYGPGTYAPEIVVPESCAIVIRDDMPLDVAALIGCAVTTGVGAVVHTAAVEPGSSVAVVGCGGIGLAAVQGARLVGASPIIAVDIADDKLERARAVGATHTVNARDIDAVEAVRELTDGGVDYSFEAIGTKHTAEQCFAMLGRHGTATVIGMVPADAMLEISGAALFSQEQRIQGSMMGSNRFRLDMPWFCDLYLDGRLKLDEMVTARRPLAEINEGYDVLRRGEGARTIIDFL